MKRGFTMIELMVAVTISMVVAGTIAVSVNKYLASEKVNETAAELVSLLNSARNTAVTGQSPAGFSLGYVGVTLTTDGVMTVYPANVGGTEASYFTKTISPMSVSLTPIGFGGLQFGVGTGKLVKTDGTPQLSTYSIGISVTSAEVDDDRAVLVSPFGAVTLLPSQ